MADKGKNRSAEEDVGSGNINQIRDILVGPYQREQEARLAQLEKALERYQKEADAATKRVQEKLDKRLDATADKLGAKISDLAKALKQAEKEQSQALQALDSEVAARIDELQAKIAADLKELEELTDENLRALRTDMEASAASLHDAKVGRQDLGDYLLELGLRLKGESSLEAIESSLKGARGGAT